MPSSKIMTAKKLARIMLVTCCIMFPALLSAAYQGINEEQTSKPSVEESGDENYAITSIWSQAEKTIDGNALASEWTLGFNNTLVESPLSVMMVENDGRNLYIHFTTPSVNPSAILEIVFDTGNDGAWAQGGEPLFIFQEGSMMITLAETFIGAPGTTIPVPMNCMGACVITGGEMLVEVQIPLGFLGLAPGGTIPFCAIWGTSGPTYMYPGNIFDLSAWAPIHTSMPDSHVPTLTNPGLSPSVPPYNTNMPYTFSIDYTDLDNNGPGDGVSLLLNGRAVAMGKQSPGDTNYVDGCTYVVTVYLPPGVSQYAFVTTSGLFIVREPSSTNHTTPDVQLVNSAAPALASGKVNRQTGDVFSEIVYSVIYSDADNNQPQTIEVVIDGVPHAMAPLLPGRHPNYALGVTYVYETTLAAGSHDFYFTCSDGTFSARDPLATNHTGPSIIAGGPTALFDGLYAEYDIPIGLMSYFTKLRYQYALLPNATYAVAVYGSFMDMVLLQTCNEDPDTGVTTNVFSASGGGGGPYQEGGRDMVWIPRNATLGNSFMMSYGASPSSMTITGESSYAYGIHNRSCWVATDGVGASVLFDKSTGILLHIHMPNPSVPGLYVDVVLSDSNAINLHAPEITQVSVDPTSGDGSTTFTFLARVSDLDGIMPRSVSLVIDGIALEMEPELPAAGAQDIAGGFDCSISTALATGTRLYHVEVFDGTSTVRNPTSSELSLVVSANNLHAPVLSDGSAIPVNGTTLSIIFFIVNYADENNNPPQSINVSVNGIDLAMQKLDPADMDMVDGCWYYRRTSLTAGAYSYHFTAHDGLFPARDPIVGDIQLNVSSSPASRLFDVVEAEYMMTIYGGLSVNFSHISGDIWTCNEAIAMMGTGSFTFNETDSLVVGGSGLGGQPGTHTLYFAPQGISIGSRFYMLDIPFLGPMTTESEYEVSDAAIRIVGGTPRACWMLQGVSDPLSTGIVEAGTGILVELSYQVPLGYIGPISAVNITLQHTNIFNYHPCSLAVHDLPSGTYDANELIRFNMTVADEDGCEPSFLRIVFNGFALDAEEWDMYQGTDWASGVGVLFQHYFPAGSYEYFVEYSDGKWYGRFPAGSNNSFTVLAINDVSPVLTDPRVTPEQTHNYTMPLYTVTYSDGDNNAPASIEVIIDGTPYPCYQYDPMDSNYIDGAEFYAFGPAMTTAAHNYSFSAFDGANLFTTATLPGPIINNSLTNITPFDGLVVEWDLVQDLGMMGMSYYYSGRDTYHHLGMYYNVSETLFASPAMPRIRFESSDRMILLDESIWQLAPGSASMCVHNTTIVYPSSEHFVVQISGTTCNFTLAGIMPHLINGRLVPAWYFQGVGAGAGSYAMVDMHTGLILSAAIRDGMGYDRYYTLTGSNALNLHSPSLSAPQVTPGAGNEMTRFTFSVEVTDGDGLVSGVYVVFNGTRVAMRALDSPAPLKDGANFTLSTYLQAGTWSYHFEVDDGLSTVSSANQSISVAHVDVAAPVVVFDPVTPDRGDEYAMFTFSLVYTDADNNAPHHAIVNINGTDYTMVAADPADTNYMDGARFWYETQLAPDAFSYEYYYNTSDDGSSNAVSSTFTDLLVRPGAPSLLADDLGYGVFVDVVMAEMDIDYLYAHVSGNRYYVRTWMNGTSIGGYYEDNATRNMTDYVDLGNMFPENFTNPFWILRNVTIGSYVRLISPDGDFNVPIVDQIVVYAMGMRFHAWVVEAPNATAYYDVETGFLLHYSYAGSGGIFTIRPRYGTMFKNYHLPTLTGGTLLNPSGNSTVMRQFSITYEDGDNVLPGRTDLVINGTHHAMVEADPLDQNVADGKDYVVGIYLPAGSYDYNFRFSDNLTTAYYPAGSNGTFVVDYANTHAPVLTAGDVAPIRGYTDDVFVFSVSYSDADNNYPISVVTSISLGGLFLGNITLVPEDPFDSNVMDGARFAGATSLPNGNYAYNFTASDGVFISHEPVMGSQTGPIVASSGLLNSTDLGNMTIGSIRHTYGGNDWENFWDTHSDLIARHASFVRLEGRVTAEMLEAIDVLWLGDYGSTPLTPQELTLLIDWVEDAGGCIVIAGTDYNMMRVAEQVLGHYGVSQVGRYFYSETSYEVNTGHPVTTGVSAVFLNWGMLESYLQTSSSPFTSVVDLEGLPQVIAYESASNGKIVALNARGPFDSIWQEDNRQLERNVFGWLGRFNRFGPFTLVDLGSSPALPTTLDLVTVWANYTDPLDDHKPRYMTLWANGTAYQMQKAISTDYGYDAGVLYEYSGYFQAGTYSYYIEAADGTSTQYTAPGMFTVSLVDLSDPTLSCWIISNTSHELTVFGIICNYSDADNNAPAHLEVIGDGGAFSTSLVPMDPSDTYYVDGALFYTNRTLPLGVHQWLVNASDDGSTFVTYPLGGPRSGPLVIELDDPICLWDGMRYNWTYRDSPSSTLYSLTTTFHHLTGDVWNITTYRGSTYEGYIKMDVVTRTVYGYDYQYVYHPGPGCFFMPRNMNVSDSLYVGVPGYGTFTAQVIYKDVLYVPSFGRFFEAVCLYHGGSGISLYYDQKSGMLLGIDYPYSYEFTATGCDAFTNDNVPVLSSPSMNPPSGSMNVPYTFQITYSDLDNNEPVGVVLVLDGVPRLMDKLVPSDANYVDGCTYTLTVYLQDGTHSYRFFASDGLFWTALPSTTNYTTPAIGFVNTNPPVISGTLLSPTSGFNHTSFLFTTTYSDADNNAPLVFWLVINQTLFFPMSPSDPLDTNFVDGVTYECYVTLSQEGFYAYYIGASDGTFSTRDPIDTMAYYYGPNVTAALPTPQNYIMHLSVPYAWQDTSGGTITSIGYYYDTVTVNLPFTVRLYDEEFTQITISGDGFVRMGSYNPYWHNSIPGTDQSNYHIVGLNPYTDLSYSDGPGFVRYAFLSGPNRVVVEFNNVYDRWSTMDLVGTYQVVIYESGMVEMHIQSYAEPNGQIFIDYGNGVNYNLYSGLNATITDWSVRFVYPSLDPFPPSIVFHEPLNSTYWDTSVPVRVGTNSPDLDYMLYNVFNFGTGTYLYANQSYAVDSTVVLTMPGAGSYRLDVWAFDTTGNMNYSLLVFTVDLGAPYAWIDRPFSEETFATTTGIPLELTGNTAAYDIIYNVWDNISSSWLYGTNQTYAGPTTFDVPTYGYYDIYAWGRTAGMVVQVTPTTLRFTVDTVAPSLTIDTPGNNTTHLGTVALDLGISDAFGNLHSAWYNVFNVGTGTWVYATNQSYPFYPVSVAFPDGVLRLYAWLNDTANNLVAAGPHYLTVDTQPPSINHPADFSCMQNQGGVQIQWVLTDLMPGQYRLLRNSVQILGWTTFTNGVPINVGVTTTSPGVFNYTIQYRDANGHYGIPDQVFVTVSAVPIAASVPDVSAIVAANSSYSINWTLQAFAGPGQYRVLRNGIQVIGWTAWGGNPAVIPVPVHTNLGLGVFNYTIHYNDSANVFGTPDSVLITVNDRPTTSHPADRVCLQFSSATALSWLVDDVYGGSGEYNVYLDGTSLTGWASFTAPGFATVPISTTVLGLYNFTIKTRDNLGFDGVQDTVMVRVDDAPTILAPPADELVLENALDFITWTIQDVEGAAGTYRIWLNGSLISAWNAWTAGVSFSIQMQTNIGVGYWNYTIEYR
ncbi:MAG: hypothetical protein JW839_05645, partial [Candidatus Lokiarchaeota archaeon]|nr:hypothetical protein [Candidatus Lokiarchaeota archaeon]